MNRLSDLLFVLARVVNRRAGVARDRMVSAGLAEAYAACERLAREHYENFPVASRLLPAPMRPHVAAVYAFARVADDFADEGERAAATSGCGCSTGGWRGCTRWRGTARGKTMAQGVRIAASATIVARASARDALIFVALAADHPRAAGCRLRSSRTC